MEKLNKNNKTKQCTIPSVRQRFTLKDENHLRKHYFKTIQTSAVNHHIPFKPRFLNKLFANISGFFWLNCHLCDNKFGGHEWYGSNNMRGVCPTCVLKHFNETGTFDNDNVA